MTPEDLRHVARAAGRLEPAKPGTFEAYLLTHADEPWSQSEKTRIKVAMSICGEDPALVDRIIP